MYFCVLPTFFRAFFFCSQERYSVTETWIVCTYIICTLKYWYVFIEPDAFSPASLFEELNMCRAVGQLQVCVPCFKQIIFCVAEGKYSKPQKITHLLGFVRRGRGCSRVRMCSEFDSLVQRRLHKEMQSAGFNVNTMEAHGRSIFHMGSLSWARCFVVFIIPRSDMQFSFSKGSP